ncbi:hypothetical protein D3C72_2051430 [compost metagenome]
MAVLEAQQLGTHAVEAVGFLPQAGRLHHRHHHLDGAGAVHFLAHDVLDLLQRTQAHRHPRVDTGGDLADEAGTQHQLLAHDIRVGGGFFLGGDEKLRGAHGVGYP